MKQTGRKALLSEAEREVLRSEFARYERIQQRYKRLMQHLSPQALGRKYNISPSTVADYARGRHKGQANYGLSAGESREAA